MVLHLECGHSSCCVCLCEDSKRVSTLAGSTLLLGTRYLNIDIGLEIDIDRSSKPTAALKRCGKNTSHKSGDVKGIMGRK